RIILALADQQRGANLIHVIKGRDLAIEFFIVIEISPPSPPSHQDVRPITWKRAVERSQVCRTHAVHPAGKHFRLHLEGEEGGEAAARPTHGRHSFWISHALIDRPAHGVEKITLRSTAPLVSPGI